MCGMLSIMVGIPGVLTRFLISKNAGLILLGVAALFGLFGVGRLTVGKRLNGGEIFVKTFGSFGLILASACAVSVFAFA